MALDGIVISKLKNELIDNLISKKVHKILQDNKDTFIFSFADINLIISANPTYPRCYLKFDDISTEANTINTNFYQNLKKYLSSGIVKRIIQPNLDRILMFEFEALNDFKEKISITLVLEMMGRYSNLILMDEKENVIDSLKHVNDSISSVRLVMPKVKYQLPDTGNKINLLNTKNDELEALINSNNDNNDFVSFVCSNFIGISKVTVENFVVMKKIVDLKENKKLNEKLDITIDNLNSLKTYILEVTTTASSINPSDNPNYIFLDNDGNAKEFYIDRLLKFSNNDFNSSSNSNNQTNNYIKFSTVSQMIEKFYSKKAFENNIKQRVSDIKNNVTNILNKALKKKEIHKSVIEESKDCDTYKIYGDLIFSNLYQLKSNESSIKVSNYYDNNKTITIKLDPYKSASDNANMYYKKYNKLKSSYKHSVEQLKDIDEEIIYLESIISYIDNAKCDEDILSIRNELEQNGYLKNKSLGKLNGKNNKSSKGSKIFKEVSKPYKFLSSDGFDIYVGKNNIQNEEVTFKIGKDSDMWLHAKDMPGSHVIIKSNNKEISQIAIDEASQLAAYFSKGRESQSVPIDYTLRKYVKKPNGSKSGFVIYLNNKTNFVNIDSKLLKTQFNINIIN